MNTKNKQFICTLPRARAIVFCNNSLLLLYRKKTSKIYYVFPGGILEPNETIEKAVIRELEEETSIIANPIRLLYHLSVYMPSNDMLENITYKNEYFWLCEYLSGVPTLSESAIENQRISSTNFYRPMWMPFYKLKNLCIYPLEIRDLLINDLNSGFDLSVKKIEVSHFNLRHHI